MIKSILGIDPVAIGAALLALIAMIGGIFFRGVKAGKDSQLAKEGKANAKALDDIARANSARSDAERLPDDKYRRD